MIGNPTILKPSHSALSPTPQRGNRTRSPSTPRAASRAWRRIPRATGTTVLAMAAVLACEGKPGPAWMSLLEGAQYESTASWRLLLLQNDPKRLVAKGSGLRLKGDRISQHRGESAMRFPVTLGGPSKVLVHVAYDRPSEAGQSTLFQLWQAGALVCEGRGLSGEGGVLFRAVCQRPGSATVVILHTAPRGTEIPVSAVAVGELPLETDDGAAHELEMMLQLLGRGLHDARGGLPDTRVFAVSTDGSTRRSAIMTVRDTLTWDAGRDLSDWELKLGCLGVSPSRELRPTLRIEGRTGAGWRFVGQWQAPVDGTWKDVFVPAGVLPRECSGLRLTVQEASGMVVVGEPIMLRKGVRSQKTNLVLLDLDTVRADRLGCYGYAERLTSASLDSLLKAKGFAIFSRTYSPAPWTVPATARFLTSRYRGANHEKGISPSSTMLAEILRDNGYYCAAFTGGLYLRLPGFEQGFHEYYWSNHLGKVEDTFPAASRWLREAPEPFFLFLHTYEAHTPYTRTTFCQGLVRGRLRDPAAGRRFFLPDTLSYCSQLSADESLYVQALYDGGVRKACEATVDLLHSLDERELWDRTVVVLLSDHGEELWEHFGVFGRHSHSLYGEVLNVPFVVYDPRHRAGHLIDEPVTTVDLVPTLAEALKLQWSGEADGVSLCPLLRGERIERSLPIIAGGIAPLYGQDGRCVYSAGFKYMEFVRSDDAFHRPEDLCPPELPTGQKLYRIDVDPREELDLSGAEPRVAMALAESLQSALAASHPGIADGTQMTGVAANAGLRRQLAALGYVSP